ncbi:hypothetical protein BWZ20_01780 [Winogradskyella sp. J14-2]|uniref:hypothetical protein n=1 Tax=Winogradskyella sp. J14-2 TaxID=1936080 RepID=UPI0009726B1E|nr:hypothetical protein [Winogradskyella sp. J14-2]APY07108.1 hypothetical protein BWZ20_01780 [Winogradskyella sp. J14-2]
MRLKQELLDICLQDVSKRILSYKNEISFIKESIESNDKISDEEGESGNAKLLEDLEKNLNYLSDAQNVKDYLNLIKPNVISQNAVLGSIVKTDSINFYIAISKGKVTVNKEDYYIISIQSPIGQLIKSKSVGHRFEFNGNNYTIKEVF